MSLVRNLRTSDNYNSFLCTVQAALASSSHSLLSLEGQRPLCNPDVLQGHYCNVPVSSTTVTHNHPLVKLKFPL